MLRELRRRKQQVADKIGHEEYIYRLNGDPFSGQEGVRVRPQGDLDPRRGAGGGGRNGNNINHNRPPFAVDSDNSDNNRGAGRPAAPLNPITGAPAGGAGQDNNNNGVALIPLGVNGNKGNINGNYASPYGPPAGYESPYRNNNNNGGLYAFSPQPVVTAFAPVMPPIAPVGELPGPLPPVFRPKPPLTFHGNNNGGGPPFIPAPLYGPNGGGDNSGNGGWPAAPLPNYELYSNNNGGRPNTSPAVLPPLTANRGGNVDSNNKKDGGNGGRSPRLSTSGAPAAAGGLIIGSGGLSDAEERYREKLAARQRAIELQQENARQMLEQQQRRQAEREREIKEDRDAENRLRREREEVARREQAEIDRENRERELKMAGPRAAQEVLEQQRKETEMRREAEAAARRNKGKRLQVEANDDNNNDRSTSSVAAEKTEVQKASEVPQTDKVETSNNNNNNGATGPLPLDQRSPIDFSYALRPAPPPLPPSPVGFVSVQPGMHNVQQYFTNIGLSGNRSGAGGITPPPPTPSPAYYAPYVLQQQQRIQLESDVIHEELRHISLLLEAQQLSNAIANNTPPPPPVWMAGPQPSSAAGAGTYLTTGLPSPLYNNNNNYNRSGGIGDVGATNLRNSPLPLPSNANAPYRPFMAGGRQPPPPLATAVSSSPSVYQQQHQQHLPSALYNAGPSTVAGGTAGMHPRQGPLSTSVSSSLPNFGNTENLFVGSYRGDGADSEELAIEPSRFVMPATAPPPVFITDLAANYADIATAAQDGVSAVHRDRSTASTPDDLAPPTPASPIGRPGTGKPVNSEHATSSRQAPPLPPPFFPQLAAGTGESPTKEKADKSNATPPSIRLSTPAEEASNPAPAVSTDIQLSPVFALRSMSNTPVRGTTPHLALTETANVEKLPKPQKTTKTVAAVPTDEGTMSTPTSLPSSSGRPRGAAVEQPVVILTPRSKGQEEL